MYLKYLSRKHPPVFSCFPKFIKVWTNPRAGLETPVMSPYQSHSPTSWISLLNHMFKSFLLMWETLQMSWTKSLNCRSSSVTSLWPLLMKEVFIQIFPTREALQHSNVTYKMDLGICVLVLLFVIWHHSSSNSVSFHSTRGSTSCRQKLTAWGVLFAPGFADLYVGHVERLCIFSEDRNPSCHITIRCFWYLDDVPSLFKVPQTYLHTMSPDLKFSVKFDPEYVHFINMWIEL